MIINFLFKILSLRSVTPCDSGCQFLVKSFLSRLGFESFLFNKNGITNSIFVYYSCNRYPKFFNYCFSGHTDVVSPGDLSKWLRYPFFPYISKGCIYSRGVCDMKGSLVSFLFSLKFLLKLGTLNNIIIVLTSDEEGKAFYGTRSIVNFLSNKSFSIDNCLIGEPTSDVCFLDTIKNGRRGSINILVNVKGKQGHTAYPLGSLNSIYVSSFFIYCISQISVVYNDIQVSIFNCPNSFSNVIPGFCSFVINIRYRNILFLYLIFIFIVRKFSSFPSCFFCYSFSLVSNSIPFYVSSSSFVSKIVNVLESFGILTTLSRFSGGTSDGRFLKSISNNIVEMGFFSSNAHIVNEFVCIKHFYLLIFIFLGIIS